MLSSSVRYEEFVERNGSRLRAALVAAYGWSQVDTAEVLGVDVSTLRTHIARGMAKLRAALEVTFDAP